MSGRCEFIFKKLSKRAKSPKRGTELSAGLDLSSAEDKVIPSLDRALVKTDLSIRLPSVTYGRIAPRSGLALNSNITTDGGVIDRNYKGNVGIILRNPGTEDFHVNIGDRVAQFICEKMVYAKPREVKKIDKKSKKSLNHSVIRSKTLSFLPDFASFSVIFRPLDRTHTGTDAKNYNLLFKFNIPRL